MKKKRGELMNLFFSIRLNYAEGNFPLFSRTSSSKLFCDEFVLLLPSVSLIRKQF